ncbi:MAG TPA: XdhC family protein, partial [Chitinophagaceae bacterium]|nr:XdhC family protein [Chitinophagaceae bacterium]
LAEKNIVYIGSLGPKKKLDRMLEELKEDGIELTNAQLANIYGPSGLDIGAETPGEIALSILAEIKAVLAGKQGRPLRSNADVIHPRTETVIEKINLSS